MVLWLVLLLLGAFLLEGLVLGEEEEKVGHDGGEEVVVDDLEKEVRADAKVTLIANVREGTSH